MLPTVRRILIALIATAVAYGVYALLAVPWIEPPLRTRPVAQGNGGTPSSPAVTAPLVHMTLLESLFPADAWERNDPKVFETDHGVFLFQEYKPLPDGRLELRPCTVVIASPPDGASERPRSAPVVMSAPGGAILQFDEDSNPARVQFGKLLGGRLPGEIRIRRQESSPGAGDDLEITTHNIQIDQQQIWTPHEVQFRYGATFGAGRDLSIALQPKAGANPTNLVGSALGGIKFVELVNVDRVHIELPVPTSTDASESSTRSARGVPSEDKQPGLFDSSSATPIEIRCRGPFRIDLVDQLASFEDQVELTRQNPTGAPDRLLCEMLRIHFLRRATLASSRSERTTEGQSERGTASSADRSLSSLFEVERVVATGQPVEFQAQAMGASARGSRLEYNLKNRLLHLEDANGAALEFGPQRIEAPNIQYEVAAEARRLGRAWASGPGRMVRAPSRPGEASLEAKWGQELLLRPQEDRHVLSLTGGTSIAWGGMGEFTAAELHAWLVESRAEGQKMSVDVDRLLAQGSVGFDSPRLQGKTQRLEAWLKREPAELTAPSTNGRASGLSNSPDVDRLPGIAGDPANRASRFQVTGDLVRLQLTQVGAQTVLDEISVQGQVEITEAGAGANDSEALRITGDVLDIHEAQSTRSTIHVIGRPALVAARGMTLVGSDVQLNQAENRVWIDGAGQMTLPAFETRSRPRGEVLFQGEGLARGNSRGTGGPGTNIDPGAQQQTTSKPTPVIVSWKGRLDFDGQTASFQRDVQVRGASRLGSGEVLDLLILGSNLDVSLNQRIEFARPQPTDGLDLRKLVFNGNIYLEGRTTLAGNVTSQERIAIRNLTIDQATGRMQGEGPGWLNTVRLDHGGSTTNNLPGGGPPPGTSRLLFVHVEFARQMVGGLQTRQVEFLDQVHAVFGPVARWEDELDPHHPEQLGESAVTLNCQRLALAQQGGNLPTGGEAVEFEATGNALVEGQKFVARAARISYSQAKDLLILAGDGRVDAEFWKKPRGNSLKPDAIARTIMYSRRDGGIDIGGAKYFDLNPYAADLQGRSGNRRP